MRPTLLEVLENRPSMEFRLYQNEPNPFSTSTAIKFVTPKDCHVRLLLYNREHELVRVLHDGSAPAGQHTLVWDGTTTDGERVADGLYTYRLEANGFVATRKLEMDAKLKNKR
jgi:flagellar hook assembly protein FlgD